MGIWYLPVNFVCPHIKQTANGLRVGGKGGTGRTCKFRKDSQNSPHSTALIQDSQRQLWVQRLGEDSDAVLSFTNRPPPPQLNCHAKLTARARSREREGQAKLRYFSPWGQVGRLQKQARRLGHAGREPTRARRQTVGAEGPADSLAATAVACSIPERGGPYHSAGKPLDGPLDFAVGALAQRFLQLVAVLQVVLVVVPLDALLLLLQLLGGGGGGDGRGGSCPWRGWLPGGLFHGCGGGRLACCFTRLGAVAAAARSGSGSSRRPAASLRGWRAAAIQLGPIHLLRAPCARRRGTSGRAGGASGTLPSGVPRRPARPRQPHF